MSLVLECETMLEVTRRRAELRPEGLAYIFLLDGEREEARLHYGELDERARAIAGHLQALGAQGRPVLLLYPPGLDYMTAFIGCLYAGAVAVPAYPPDPSRLGRTLPRLEALVADCGAQLALTHSFILSLGEAMAEQAPSLARLSWVATDALPSGSAESWREPALTRDSLALLQYTSGSTGAPRGVMLTHGNLLHNSAAIYRVVRLPADSVGVGWLPPYHDMGLIAGVLQPLCGGFPAVHMSPLDFLQRPRRWLEALSRYRANCTGAPNFAYELCVKKTTPEQRAALDLSRLELAFSGAEPVRAETIERFSRAFAPSGFRREAFFPAYGLAEATLFVTGGGKGREPVVRSWQAEALRQGRAVEAVAAEGARRLVGCGSTFEDQQLAIVDPESLTPLPEGRVGEVWVRGPSVAVGYWKRPEETERTFHARLASGGEGLWLRTGDLGFLSGGGLFFAGRLKDLIIIRGRNHYPQDLEQTAEASHPSLRPGCSVAFSVESEGGERLVLALEVDPRRPAEPQAVAEAVRRAVAEHHEVAVSTVVLLPPGALPKTSSGKVQRRPCREQYLAGTLEVMAELITAREEPVRPPESPPLLRQSLISALAEQRQRLVEHLRQRLSSALGVPASELEEHQPLTALGMDSMQAMELAGALQEELGVRLPLALLLDGASLGTLAARILQALQAPATEALPPLERSAQPPVLSYAQERLLFMDELVGQSSAYNVVAAALLEGQLHEEALALSLGAILQRHEVLRARFPREAMWRRCVVEERAPWSRPLAREGARVDLGSLPEAEREAQARRLLEEEARQPFDLEQGPLLRVRLIRLAPERHLLVLAVHHIVSDGWSMGVLVRELGALYAAFRGGQDSPLPELPVQYTDWAGWQRRWLAGGTLESELSWWRQQLAGAPALLELPGARPRQAMPLLQGARHPLGLSAELTAGLHQLARAEGATLFMVLLSGWLALLHERTGRTDLVVGTDVAGREHPRTQGLIGLFVNQLVLRTQLGGNPTLRELLGRVRQVALSAYSHAHVPFSRLVEALCPPRDVRYNPLFQVMFVLESAPLPPLELPGLKLRLVEVDEGGAPFDLSVLLSESSGRLRGALRYSTALYEADSMARLAEDYEAVLELLVTRAEAPLEELRGLLAERRQARAPQGAQVRVEPPPPGQSLPAVVRPAVPGLSLEAWALSHREQVEELLHRHGALLFRGFGVATAEQLESLIHGLEGAALPYEERSSPRSQVRGRVYTSTEHPHTEPIFLHNEQSYNLTFPLRLFFCCVTPAREGGGTPLADSRRVFQRLSAPVRERLLAQGYQYVRNFGHGLGLSWQEAFQTEEPAVVEEYCRRNGIEYEWREGHQRLRTRQVRRAAGRHPITGEPVWFNHATFFHVSTLPEPVASALRADFSAQELPNNTCYGDGSPLEEHVLEELRAAYLAERSTFRWERGDVLLVDNMLAAHGREPFTGPRLVLAGMARPFRWEEVPPVEPGEVQPSLPAARAQPAPPRSSPQGEPHRWGPEVDTTRTWEVEGLLHERFAAQAWRTPERTAVVFESRQLTYAELAEQAWRLAWHLRGLGVGAEERVGLLLERSVEQVVGLLGILGAGGAFVPLELTWPRERHASVLRQAGVRLVLTRLELLPLLPEGAARPVLMDADAEAIASSPATPPPPGAAPGQLAYVLFTSGSTGQPKGVLIEHRSVLNLAAALEERVYRGLGSGRRVSLNAPLVFDASVKQWVQLLHGHTLHVVPEEVRVEPGRMCEWVRQQQVEVLDCTPSQLGPLLERGLGEGPWPLRVLVGGEALEARTWEVLVVRGARTRFFNVYGPTECTVDATACEVSESPTPSLGGALGNVRVHVLDERLRPVPVGVRGELYIGGAGVGRGYVGQPALTAERFLPDPSGPAGARLYRTGDLGRWREDGYLEYLGRVDSQVKLRGLRIELGEIESVLLAHEEVAEAAVVVREVAPGERHLAGYVVPRAGPAEPAALVERLRAWLRERLPEYMVPWALVPLERMPLNRHGKLDRGALPEPHRVLPRAAPEQAPSTPLEHTLAALWRELLRVEAVGLHSNFFDLGGHSLLMVQVRERLAAELGVRLSLVELFQHPTVALLARHLAQVQQGGGAAAPEPPEEEERARRQQQALRQQGLRNKSGRDRS